MMKPGTVDDYVAACPANAREILERIREVVRAAAPEAEETIRYGVPTFKLEGVLVHFGAFKEHIGLYPPVRGDAGIEKAVARYAGEKGNLRFSLDEPIPYDLIGRIVRSRVEQNLAKAKGRRAPRNGERATRS